jgi:murein DD-endopeptidase MepM/ murein hydrolase activator NlpD
VSRATLDAMTAPPPRRPFALVLAVVTAVLVVAPLPAVGAVVGAAAAPAVPRAGPPAPPARFGWPLAAPHPVVRPFEAPASPYGPGHRGVDLGGVVGAPVLSAGDGVVVFAGPVAGRGVVSVDHPNGLRTTYEPVAPAVRAGGRVEAGTVLGLLRPGHAECPAACLHWGVRRGAEYLDPLALVARGHVRLLPWEEVG